jgi:hypothetical protein
MPAMLRPSPKDATQPRTVYGAPARMRLVLVDFFDSEIT